MENITLQRQSEAGKCFIPETVAVNHKKSVLDRKFWNAVACNIGIKITIFFGREPCSLVYRRKRFDISSHPRIIGFWEFVHHLLF
jgi:hypothetical protein